jgi:hypothetical protein
MTDERPSPSRAELAKMATTRTRRSRELSPEAASGFARARSRARAVIAGGVAGIAAGVGLVIAAHPAVGALPLIAGGIVAYRGERRLSRVDAAFRKARYGRAAATSAGAFAEHNPEGAMYYSGDSGGGCGGGN